MLFPYYCVLQNGQIEAVPVGEFRLHDSREQFDANPRVFTTFLARRAGEKADREVLHVTGFDLHKARLLADGAAFGFETNTSSGENLLEGAIDILTSKLRHFATEHAIEIPERFIVRIVLGKESAELYLDHFIPRWNAAHAVSLRTYQAERFHPSHKTTATGVSIAAHEHAAALGADEALLIGTDKLISEGAWSNFFWFAKDGSLFTPGHKILPGITREILFNEVPLDFKSISFEALQAEAQEAFISLSTYGIVPVRDINGWLLPGGAPGVCTKSILALWNGFETDYSNQLSTPK